MNWGWLKFWKRKKAEVIPLPVKPSRSVLVPAQPWTSKATCGKCKRSVSVARTYADGKVRCVECADRGR